MALGQIFDTVAETYQAVRPGYPLQAIRALTDSIALTPSASLVEVGAGTGKATEAFVTLGFRPICVEPGKALAEVLLKRFPQLTVIPATFESWVPEQHSIDLLYGAQSLHWLEPHATIEKVAVALKPGGTFALIWNVDESFDTEFYIRAQEIHERFFPTQTRALPVQSGLTHTVQLYQELLESSPSYKSLVRSETPWSEFYTTEQWLALRGTFSPHLSLSEAERAAFHNEIRSLLDSLGGGFMRAYRTVILIASTRGGNPAC